MCPRMKFSIRVSSFSGVLANLVRSSEEKVYEVVLKEAALVKEQRKQKALDLSTKIENDGMSSGDLLNEAYNRCGEICAEYAKTFYLGISSSFLLMLSFSKELIAFCLFVM